MKILRNMLKRERRPGDLVFAVVFVIAALLLAAAIPSQAQFVAGTKLVSQPGFWPVIGVTMMVFFGGIHLFSSLISPRLIGRFEEVWLWARSLELVAWFFIYVTVIPVVGYLLATLIFVLSLSLRLGYRSIKILGSAVLFAFSVVLIFKTGLGVALPVGEIYEYLPDGIRNVMMKNF